MKRMLVSALCAVFIAACGGGEQETQTGAAPAADALQASKAALGLGFDVANMNQDTRPQDDFYRYK